MPGSYHIPAPPKGFDPTSFFSGLYWHQRWQMFEGVYTPGCNPVAELCDQMHLPHDLSGKRVLDIGAWNGCFSFECERRGAAEIVALEPTPPEETGFYRLRDAIGSKRTKYLRGSVYHLDPKEIGTFDCVIFAGVLYHLRYPMLGIDNIRRVCRGQVYIETYLLDHALTQQVGPAAPVVQSLPIWEFYRSDELYKAPSNWVGPTSVAVVQAFESAGFQTELLSITGERGTLLGRVKEGPPEFLTICCGEAVYYDVLVSHLLGKRKRSPLKAAVRRVAGSLGMGAYLDSLARILRKRGAA